MNQTDLVTPSPDFGDYFTHAVYIKATTSITQIDVRHTGTNIEALYVTYSDGVNTVTVSNGNTGAPFSGTLSSVTLDSNEYIVLVKGSITQSVSPILQQISFYSSQDNVYGPYGAQSGGIEFDISFPGDTKLLYFHGTEW